MRKEITVLQDLSYDNFKEQNESIKILQLYLWKSNKQLFHKMKKINQLFIDSILHNFKSMEDINSKNINNENYIIEPDLNHQNIINIQNEVLQSKTKDKIMLVWIQDKLIEILNIQVKKIKATHKFKEDHIYNNSIPRYNNDESFWWIISTAWASKEF